MCTASGTGKCGCGSLGRLDRLGTAVDVVEAGAGKPAHDRLARALANFLHGGEIASEAMGKPAAMTSTAHLVEHLGDIQLLLVVMVAPGQLLAVAQGGIENDDAVRFGLGVTDMMLVLSFDGPRRAARSLFLRLVPLSARPQGRPALRGA